MKVNSEQNHQRNLRHNLWMLERWIYVCANNRGRIAKNFRSVCEIMEYATCCWGFKQKTRSHWVSTIIIVLVAACDATYSFTLFVLDQYGSKNKSRVLANSSMGTLFEDNSFNLLEGKPLNETKEKTLHFNYFVMKLSLLKHGWWVLFLYRILMRNKEFITIVTVEQLG